MSGLLAELMAALSAGNRHLAYFSRQTQACLAFGTTEIAEFLDVLHAHEELAEIGFEVVADIQILLILRCTFHTISGESANDRPDIGGKTNVIKDKNACNTGEQRKYETTDEKCKGELIQSMSAHHEITKTIFNFMPH